MADFAIILTFILVPFGFLSLIGPVHTGHLLAFFLSGCLIFAFQIRNVWVKCFFIYAISWQFSLYIAAFFSEKPTIPGGNIMLLYLFIGMVVYHYVSISQINLKYFYNAICIAALLQGVIAIFQYLGIDIVYLTLKSVMPPWRTLEPVPHAVGTLTNQNFLGAFMAISLPFFFRKRWVYLIPVIVLALWFSLTTTAVVAAVCGVVVYFRKAWALLAALVVVIGYNGFIDPSRAFQADARLELWAYSAGEVLSSFKSFLFGVGPDYTFHYTKGFESYSPHNAYVTVLLHYGVVGLCLVAGFIATVYRGNRLLFAAFIAAIVSCLGNPTIELAPSAFLVLIILGLLERERYEPS